MNSAILETNIYNMPDSKFNSFDMRWCQIKEKLWLHPLPEENPKILSLFSRQIFIFRYLWNRSRDPAN